MSKEYCVYIMANKHNTTIYTGVTNNIYRRVEEHRNGEINGFTKRYNLHKLVYYEVTDSIDAAILREKQIKSWKREKKNRLINSLNPEWLDLYDKLFEE